MLYLVATPIGNLGDITFRAVETLKNCDLILCEDTRHTLKLLNHYAITKPLLSYHQFNEESRLKSILEKLRAGKLIALVSDAGTPLISDPGFKLIESCIREQIPFTAIPGPCAPIDALLLSGLNSSRFQFVGFFPRTQKELKALFLELIRYPGTSIGFESPKRVAKTLALLCHLAPDTQVVLARELTKKFEELLRGSASELSETLKKIDVKGECVVLIAGGEEKSDFSQLTLKEHVELVQKQYQLTEREAIKLVAELRGASKRSVYNQIMR